MDATKSKRALIVAGGNPVKSDIAERIETPDWIVAADSGLDQAYRLGLSPDLVVGDMDSVSPAALDRAAAAGVDIERHPTDKDATDLELAIEAAIAAGFERATIIGGTGGRMAHTLANAMLLLKERSIALTWTTSHASIAGIRTGESRRYLREEGPLLSVLAVGGQADCISSGLRWPLGAIALVAGSTRGVSNEINEAIAQVSVISGQVLTVHERNDQ